MDFPINLIDDLARRRAVLFLGAGVSQNSLSDDGKRRPPLWLGFLKECSRRVKGGKKHVNDLIRQGDYLTAADVLKHSLGSEWDQIIDDEFVKPKFRPAAIHDAIFKLDVRVCMTQNVDKIYDTHAQYESSNTIVVKTYYDNDVASVIRGDRRCVIKAHGSVDSTPKMVFTRRQYADARHQYSTFYSLVDALALTHTFLFVGCGISDPDVQLMLERMAQLHPFARPHYFLAPKGQLHKEIVGSLRRTMNLEVLEYKRTNDHKHLTSGLVSLGKTVDARRYELADQRDW